MRLDDILLSEKLATKEQIREAMEYQRSFGGRLETHLYRFGYVSEVKLARILSIQFGFPPITLSGITIPGEVLSLIPPSFAWKKLVLPFEYDPIRNIVKVACEFPQEEDLLKELYDLIPGKNIELYVALGLTLRNSLVRHYRADIIAPIQSHNIVPINNEKPPAILNDIKNYRILMLNRGAIDVIELEQALKQNGFEVILADSADQFIDYIVRKNPQIAVINIPGKSDEVRRFITRLMIGGVTLDDIPTYLVVDDHVVAETIPLLETGIEDILPQTWCTESILIKLDRIRDLHESIRDQQIRIIQDIGTHGSLSDMNVVDLLQMMGPTRKTVRINITGNGEQLTLYLNNGSIIYAECDEKIGAEAVYQSMTWNHGVWSIDPIDPSELPEPNNDLTIDSLLLEGCRLLDENNRQSESCETSEWF